MLTKEQIEFRKTHIGGSDSATILGANPFASIKDLWMEKCGLSSPLVATPAMERGIYLEAVAAEMYSKKTGRKLRKVNRTLIDKKDALFIAHIDRHISEKPPGVLEIKCPGINTFYKMKQSGIPPYVLVQANHYLMITGFSFAAVSVFSSELWESINVDIPRDDEVIEMIRKKGREFWQYVERRVEPEDKLVEKSKEIELPPVTQGELITVEGDKWTEALTTLRNAQDLKKAAEEIEKKSKDSIKVLMDSIQASAIRDQTDSVRVYFKEQAGRISFDIKAFKAAHPELKEEIERFEKQGDSFRTLRSFFLGKNLLDEY